MIIAQKNYTAFFLCLKTYTECNVNCNFPMAIKISARCDHYQMVIYENKKNSLKTTKNYNTLPIYTIVNLTLEKCNWNVFFYYIFCAKKPHRIFIKSPSKYPHMQLYISLSHSLSQIYTHFPCDTKPTDSMMMMMRLHDQWQIIFSLQNDNDCVTHLKLCF